VISQDTGMAMTLIGFIGASPGGRHTDGTVHSEELQAPTMRGAERRAWAALPGAEGSRDLPPDGPVIHTDRLFAARAGQ
jgi:hypothetical protein